MKNPQLENGYIKLANDIVDQLCKLYLTSCEWQIIWVVLRQTYGWNKKTDNITLTQFEKMTGMERSRVCKTIKKLVSKRTLLKDGSAFSFNKCVSQWVVSERTPPSVQTGNLGLKKESDIKKESLVLQKTIVTRFAPPSVLEVEEYCQSKKYSFDPEAFVAYYGSIGWMVGKHKMKDWKKACTTWQKNQLKRSQPPPPQPSIYPDEEELKKWKESIRLPDDPSL